MQTRVAPSSDEVQSLTRAVAALEASLRAVEPPPKHYPRRPFPSRTFSRKPARILTLLPGCLAQFNKVVPDTHLLTVTGPWRNDLGPDMLIRCCQPVRLEPFGFEACAGCGRGFIGTEKHVRAAAPYEEVA